MVTKTSGAVGPIGIQIHVKNVVACRSEYFIIENMQSDLKVLCDMLVGPMAH